MGILGMVGAGLSAASKAYKASQASKSSGSSSSSSKSSGSSGGSSKSPTINDYKKQYDDAKARGDAAGMQAANNGANAIRVSQGQAPEYATTAINEASGSWIGNGKSSSSSQQNKNNNQLAYDSYAERQQREAEEYQRELERKREEEARIAQQKIQEGINQGVNRLDSQRYTIGQTNDDLARQAYIAKRQSENSLPQILASQGITGGATESTLLGLETSYGNNIGDIERQRNEQLRGLDNAILDLKNTGDLEKANAAMTSNQQALADYRDAYGQKLAQNNFAAQFMQSQQQIDQAKKQQEMQNYVNTIGAYSQNYQGEIDRLRAMGVPEDDPRILALNAARNEKMTMQLQRTSEIEKLTGGGDGNQEMTFSQAKYAWEQGYDSPEIRRALGFTN